MGKWDKEVTEAKKILDGWVKESEKYEGQLIVLKKENLTWEKHAIQRTRELLDSKKYETDKAAAGEIEGNLSVGPERLEMFAKEAQRLYDAHKAWALGDPRDSYLTIARMLKLGKKGEERYEGVKKELGSILEKVSKTIRETEGVFTKDVKFAIENQRLKLKAIAKEYKSGGENREKALTKQLAKITEEFKTSTQKVLDGIHYIKDQGDLERVLKKDPGFEAMDPPKKKEKYQQYQNKLGLIPGSNAMIEKNYGRIQKSFPQDFMNGAGKAGFDAIADVKEEALLKLKVYDSYYKKVKKAFEDRKWN
jgi:hypothetical protein